MSFYEIEEVERTVKELGLDLFESGAQTAEKLAEMFEKAPLVELTDEDWSILQNTDSYAPTAADMIASKVYKNIGVARFQKIFSEMVNGIWYPPLILKIHNILYLVAGNTWLMVAQSISRTPLVKIVEI